MSPLTYADQNYDVPKADKLQPREQREVDRYRALRERFHDGPYHAIVNEASTSAKKDSKLRAQFDPFHGMPSYTEKYRKRKRTIPHLAGREYGTCAFRSCR
jgi:DNA-directed RNA polymerase III subunit RPC7